MNRIRFVTMFLCMLLFSSAAAAPVWKVSVEDKHLFIGGTIHVLEARDYPLPDVFEQAYRAAETLVFEVDLQQSGSLVYQQALLQAALYDDGSTLADHLESSTLSKLRAFMQQRGLPLESMLPFRVGMLVTFLTLNELQRHGIRGEGVEQYFSRRALQDNKPVVALESIEQQIRYIAHMGEGEEDQMVRHTLAELDNFAAEFAALKSAWRAGDTQALERVGLDDFQVFPDAYESMLVERNRNWLEPIETMLQTESVEYVLVGVLHLVGPDSVLALLEARGYRVEQLQ